MSKFYKVIYSKRAKKFISKNNREGIKFFRIFEEISYDRKNIQFYDVKNMIGYDNEYRLRIGQYRALFQIIEDEIIILVIDISSRGQIYKKK